MSVRDAEVTAVGGDDVERARNVCILGQTVREHLFGDEDPVGQMIRLNGQPFEVIGLFAATFLGGCGWVLVTTASLKSTALDQERRLIEIERKVNRLRRLPAAHVER